MTSVPTKPIYESEFSNINTGDTMYVYVIAKVVQIPYDTNKLDVQMEYQKTYLKTQQLPENEQFVTDFLTKQVK